MTSSFVFETQFKGQKSFYDLVSRTVLPITASEDELSYCNMLEGQESNSLETRLFRSPKHVGFRIIPTWQCNLRCPHCYVMHDLKGPAAEVGLEFPVDDFVGFVERLHDRYKFTHMTLAFLGGESFLKPETCSTVIDKIDALVLERGIKIRKIVTSNLCYNIGEQEEAYLKKLDHITVSVDGPEHVHNAQRKSATVKNPYRQTISNLHKIMSYMNGKVSVQGAIGFEDATPQNIADFIYVITSLGIPREKIQLGYKASTKRYTSDRDNETEFLKTHEFFTTPCCAWRFMSNFIVGPNGMVSGDFHDTKQSSLGYVHDPVKTIEQAFKDNIYKNMAVLNDETCKKCPALGVCWGRCVNTRPATENKPSLYCDQKGLIEKVKTMADAGTLVESFDYHIENPHVPSWKEIDG